MPDVEGIKITRYWLLKFGFKEFIQEQNSTNDIDYRKENFLLDMNTESWKIEIHYSPIRFEKRHLIGSLEFVHQLQNLYFILTNEELTLKEEISIY